jgi:hypothetical protein
VDEESWCCGANWSKRSLARVHLLTYLLMTVYLEDYVLTSPTEFLPNLDYELN